MASKSSAQSSPKALLLALSKADHTLALVDPITLKVLARVPVGSDPHEVIASSDGKTAYVSIYGGGSLHEINVIDLVAQKPLTPIDTRPLYGPHGLDFAAGKLWFSAEGSKAVGRYDPATGKLDWSMGTGQNRTHMVYVAGNGKRVYTTNVSSATVSILIDSLLQPGNGPGGASGNRPGGGAGNGGGPGGAPGKGTGGAPGNGQGGGPGGFGPPGGGAHMDWIQAVIPVARGSEGFDVSPDGRELWTAGSDDGIISILDPIAMKPTGTIEAKVAGANRLKFTPDGKLVLVTSLRSGDLFIFDAATHKEIKKLSTGHGAAGILVDPDGSRAFIGCTSDNYVAVVDLKSLEIVNHINVGGGPDGLAWAVQP